MVLDVVWGEEFRIPYRFDADRPGDQVKGHKMSKRQKCQRANELYTSQCARFARVDYICCYLDIKYLRVLLLDIVRV